MPFDPSVISQIPDMAPDPVGAKARGFQLADLVNTEQLNKLRLNQVKTEENESLQMKEILKKEDLSTPQGITKAAQALTKAGLAEKGMKLMGTAQQYQTGAVEQENAKIKNDLLKLEDHAARMDRVAEVADGVRSQLEEMKKAKATPEMLDLMAIQKIVPAMKQLAVDEPSLKPQIDQFLASKDHMTYAGVVHFEETTNFGQQRLKQERETLQSKLQARNVESEISVRESKEKREAAAATPGPASQATIAAAATGMPLNQLSSGYGKAAAADRKAIRDGAIQMIKQQTGMDDVKAGQEYARRTIEFSSGKMSVQQLTKMEGATRAALGQLDFNVKKATEFMDKVPAQTDLSPVINGIINKEETWTGNPNMAPLFFYMNGVAQEAARLQSGGQASAAQLHQGAADEAKKWLDAGKITPASWKALAPEIMAEGQNRLQNFTDAKAAMSPGEKDTPKTLTYDPATGTFK